MFSAFLCSPIKCNLLKRLINRYSVQNQSNTKISIHLQLSFGAREAKAEGEGREEREIIVGELFKSSQAAAHPGIITNQK